MMKHILGSAILISALLCGCGRSPAGSTVTFVDRAETSVNGSLSEREDPLLLVLEIAEDGRLALNKIDVGTTADLDLICEKLEVIFDDRTRAGINRKEVVIEMKGNISGADLEDVIERLAGAKAIPIRVIKGSK